MATDLDLELSAVLRESSAIELAKDSVPEDQRTLLRAAAYRFNVIKGAANLLCALLEEVRAGKGVMDADDVAALERVYELLDGGDSGPRYTFEARGQS